MCLAVTLVVGGLALLLLGLLPGGLSVGPALAVSSERLRSWGEVCSLAGAALLAGAVLVACLEAHTSGPPGEPTVGDG